MAAQISRYHSFKPSAQISLATTLGATPEINFEEFAGGVIYIPSGSAITTLTFYAAPRQSSSPDPLTRGGNTQPAQTYYALHDSADTAITQLVTAGCCYMFPVELFGAGSIKITANAAGAVEISVKG